MWIVPISIGLIMILLYTAFNSLKDALLVMVNVVAATMGGVWALKLTGTPFSISAAVGFISIFGVAVQDGVLLDLVLQPDAPKRSAGARCRDARGRAARAARGHDLTDRGARVTSRCHGHFHRLASPEAAGDRRGRRHARDSVSDPLPDAGALHLFSSPRQYSCNIPSKVNS